LGGGKTLFWGTVIVDKFLVSRDWQVGSALTFLGIMSLILISILIYLLFSLLQRLLRVKL
jgi:ABC-type spermidine/putrescine transport system permease subunit I